MTQNISQWSVPGYNIWIKYVKMFLLVYLYNTAILYMYYWTLQSAYTAYSDYFVCSIHPSIHLTSFVHSIFSLSFARCGSHFTHGVLFENKYMYVLWNKFPSQNSRSKQTYLLNSYLYQTISLSMAQSCSNSASALTLN